MTRISSSQWAKRGWDDWHWGRSSASNLFLVLRSPKKTQDGIFENAAGAYPHCSRSSSSLPTKSYFNAQHAKECLRTTQPAGKSARILGPACASFPDIVTCKIGDDT
jgi:hypothetical protein